MSYIEDTLINLQNFGIMYLLAFLLVFTLIYAILTKSKILGEKKNFNIAVALVIGLLVILEPSHTIVNILATAIPNISIVIVAVLMFMLLIGLMGGKTKMLGGSASGWIALVSAAVVLYIFGVSAGWWGRGHSTIWWLQWLNNPQTVSTVIVLLIFGIVIWFVTKDETPQEDDKKFMHKLGEMFKGDKE